MTVDLKSSSPAKPLFISTSGEYGVPQGGGRLDILARSEPTEVNGIGVVRMRFDSPVDFVWPPTNYHAVWLQRSPSFRMIVRMDDRPIDCRLVPGSVIIYPGAADTVLEGLTPAEGIGCRISAECLALAGAQLKAHGATIIEKTDGFDDTLSRIGDTLEAEAAAGHPNGMLFWSSVVDAFIRHLAAHHLSRSSETPRGAVGLKAIRRLDDHIQANPAAPLDLESLAAVIGCDRFHLAHRFRATVGMSPHRYVMRMRLARARERVETGAGSLAEIALATGFADQSHLCHWARRVYNMRLSHLRS